MKTWQKVLLGVGGAVALGGVVLVNVVGKKRPDKGKQTEVDNASIMKVCA